MMCHDDFRSASRDCETNHPLIKKKDLFLISLISRNRNFYHPIDLESWILSRNFPVNNLQFGDLKVQQSLYDDVVFQAHLQWFCTTNNLFS